MLEELDRLRDIGSVSTLSSLATPVKSITVVSFLLLVLDILVEVRRELS